MGLSLSYQERSASGEYIEAADDDFLLCISFLHRKSIFSKYNTARCRTSIATRSLQCCKPIRGPSVFSSEVAVDNPVRELPVYQRLTLTSLFTMLRRRIPFCGIFNVTVRAVTAATTDENIVDTGVDAQFVIVGPSKENYEISLTGGC